MRIFRASHSSLPLYFIAITPSSIHCTKGALTLKLEHAGSPPLQAGTQFRVNYYRFQGPPPKRANIAWLPTGPTGNHHIPEKFGLLKLEK